MAVWKRIALVLVILVGGLTLIHDLDKSMSLDKSDLQPVQIGVRATLRHEDPYSEATTRKIQIAYYGRALTDADHVNRMGYAYPWYTAYILAPLAWLTFDQARICFWILVPILSAVAAWLWLRVAGTKLERKNVVLAVGLMLASYPFLWAMRLQQVTLLVFVLLAVGCWLFQTGRAAGAGVVLGLSLFKPQLACILIAWLCLWAIVHRMWRFVISLALCGTLLLAASEIAHSGWFSAWRSAGVALVHYTKQHPPLVSVLGQWIGIPVTTAIAAWAIFVLWKLRKATATSPEFGRTVGLALAVTLTLLPTDTPMGYNFVLLLPAVLVFFTRRDRSVFDLLTTVLICWLFSAPVFAVFYAMHPAEGFIALPMIAPFLAAALTVSIALSRTERR